MHNLEVLLNAICAEGMYYGLELNWFETGQMQISTGQRLLRPDGQEISSVREAVYSGGLITCDGKAGRELFGRVGECKRVFDQLLKLWSQAGVTKARKPQIHGTCVLS